MRNEMIIFVKRRKLLPNDTPTKSWLNLAISWFTLLITRKMTMWPLTLPWNINSNQSLWGNRELKSIFNSHYSVLYKFTLRITITWQLLCVSLTYPLHDYLPVLCRSDRINRQGRGAVGRKWKVEQKAAASIKTTLPIVGELMEKESERK